MISAMYSMIRGVYMYNILSESSSTKFAAHDYLIIVELKW